MENKEKIIVGSERLSQLLGYKNRNYISELVNDFGMPKVNYNEFDLDEVITWHVEYLKSLHRAEIDRIKQEKPQDDLARKNAILKQMEIDEREGQLMPKAQFAELLYNIMGLLKTGLEGIGPNAATDLIDKHDTKEIIAIINKRINKLKEDLSSLGADILQIDNAN